MSQPPFKASLKPVLHGAVGGDVLGRSPPDKHVVNSLQVLILFPVIMAVHAANYPCPAPNLHFETPNSCHKSHANCVVQESEDFGTMEEWLADTW